MAWLIPSLIVIGAVVAMEIIASAVHRHVMHGFGWRWHKSHHEPRQSWFEANDLFAILFASVSLCLFIFGTLVPTLWWVALGMSLYGALYSILHDGLVHRRLPIRIVPRNGYVKRLVQAHRLHHASRMREGAVSFGFLYAPPVRRLIAEMDANKVEC